MKLAEFFVSLVVDSDKKELNDFTQGVSELDKTLGQLKLAATALAIKAFTDATVDSAVAIQNFTNQTGLLGEQLQKFQIAAELSDITITAEGAVQSLANLEQNLAQIRLGGGNVSPFQLLGIDVAGKDTFQVIEDVRGAIKGLDNATATNLITQLGLSPQFINVLRLTNEEFDNLFGDRALLSKEKRDDVVAMGTAFTDLRLRIVALKDQFVAAFAPALTAISNSIGRFVERITQALDSVNDWTTAVKALGVTLLALVARFNPLILKITAVVALFDDLMTFFQGGDSLIGRFIEAVTRLGKAVGDFLLKPLEMVVEQFGKLKESLSDINPLGSFDLSSPIDSIMKVISPSSGGANMKNTFNNTYNINSNADGNSIARGVTNTQQREFNYAAQEFNNGFAN